MAATLGVLPEARLYLQVPFAGKHPIKSVVHKVVIEPLGFAESAFETKTQPFRNRTALSVFHSTTNLDSVQP
jgi:hypothetical protein